MAQRVRKRILQVGSIVLLLVAAIANASEPLETREWLEITSDNFRIRSVLGEERTIELLRHLEVMRAALGDASDEPTYEAAIPTVIIAVDEHDDYVRVGAPAATTGYFAANMRENAILIMDGGSGSGIHVMLHEFAHYMNHDDEVRYPRWFEEGNAEYLSNSRLLDQAFEFGIAPRRYMATLGLQSWMKVAELLSVNYTAGIPTERGDLFYAQSWLLLHYLRSQPDIDRDLPARIQQYTRNTGAGTPVEEAFESAFGVSTTDVDEALLQYFLQREFQSRRLPVDTALNGFDPRVRAMSPAETRLALARMALHLDSLDNAAHWFEELLADEAMRAHAEAGLGRIAGLRGDLDAAGRHFESAIYLMAWDFTIWMDYAQFWSQRVTATQDSRERRRAATKLLEAVRSALTIADETPEVNALMGFGYLALGGNDIVKAIDHLEAAEAAAPHDQPTRILLANVYLYMGRIDDAERLAQSALRYEHEPNSITDAAQDILMKARAAR